MNLSSTSRYLRMGRLVIKLPTYARVVWGIFRDPRTPIGLKGMMAAALAEAAPGRFCLGVGAGSSVNAGRWNG